MNTPIHSPAPSRRFQAEQWIIAQHGKSAIVRLTERLDDVAALTQDEVMIDGCLYRCSRVCSADHAPPFRTGEYITLLVETPDH